MPPLQFCYHKVMPEMQTVNNQEIASRRCVCVGGGGSKRQVENIYKVEPEATESQASACFCEILTRNAWLQGTALAKERPGRHGDKKASL